MTRIKEDDVKSSTYTSVVSVPPCAREQVVTDRKAESGEEDCRDEDRVSLEQRVVDYLLGEGIRVRFGIEVRLAFSP